jgi:hypothetical protein
VQRDKLLERLIDIGVYDHSNCLDLNDDPAEKRSFRYVVVLTNMLWDRVHDLESEVAFALVLCFHITEQLPRTFTTLSRCKALTTPSNVSVVEWLRASEVTKNTGQCRWPPCTKNSRTARTRQVDIRRRQLASGTRVAPRLVSSMPFRVCLKLIEVAIDRRVPPSFGVGPRTSVSHLQREEDIGGEPRGCCSPNGAGSFKDRGTRGKSTPFSPQ